MKLKTLAFYILVGSLIGLALTGGVLAIAELAKRLLR